MTFDHVQNDFNSSFEHVANKFGHRLFVKAYTRVGVTTEKTYSEFYQDVRNVSSELLAQFSNFNVLATRSQNSYEHLVYIAAILYAGFKFCPLNPNDTAEKTAAKIKQLDEPVHVLEDLDLNNLKVVNSITAKPRIPHEPFILVFTSGSTGLSKVVEQTEIGILSNAESLIRHHGLSEGQTRIATPLPLFHVNALEFSFLTTLLAGQTLVLYETFDAFQILKSLTADKVNILSVVPHLLFALSQQLEKLKKLDLGSFRYFVTAAAPLPYSMLKTFSDSGFKVIQGYGMSEAVNFSLKTPVNLTPQKILSLAEPFQRPTAGIPIWGNEVQIFDSKLTPCLEGDTGEVHIRGINLMLSYRGDNPKNLFKNGYFNTGDLGFWRFDSETKQKYFYITGRTKDIAKKNGTTVSLVEMDEALLRVAHEKIDLISVAIEDAKKGEDLAIVVKGLPADIEPESYFAGLLSQIPQTFRPKLIHLSEQNLRTESGKPLRWTFQKALSNFLALQSGNRETYIWDERPKNDSN